MQRGVEKRFKNWRTKGFLKAKNGYFYKSKGITATKRQLSPK
jgi:hypothetical protein